MGYLKLSQDSETSLISIIGRLSFNHVNQTARIRQQFKGIHWLIICSNSCFSNAHTRTHLQRHKLQHQGHFEYIVDSSMTHRITRSIPQACLLVTRCKLAEMLSQDNLPKMYLSTIVDEENLDLFSASANLDLMFSSDM